MRKKELSKIVLKVSEGVVANLTDLVLAQIFFGLEFAAARKRTFYDIDRAMERAYVDSTEINYQQLKRAFLHLKKKGFVGYVKREKILLPQITETGKKRLEGLFPFYDTKRVWDKRIYLITYDIPETKKRDRDILREYLRKIGCGMLQASVWLTPYNPKEVLRKFIEEKGLRGQVLISDLGKDGSIGEEDINELVARVYKLEELIDRYFRFIQEWQGKKVPDDLEKSRINFSFLSILIDDPQLPFELLPEDWPGDKAYEIVKMKNST